MPQSGRNLDAIRRDANITDGEFDEYKDKLGNKILLGAKMNRQLGNDWFRTKRSKYKSSSYSLAKSLGDYPSDKWTKEDIDKMTEKAADRIVNFIFGDESTEEIDAIEQQMYGK